MKETLLSVESDATGEIVELHMDRCGLDYLIEVLTQLRNASPPEHVHLLTAEWGGVGLMGPPQNPKYVAAKHLKACLW